MSRLLIGGAGALGVFALGAPLLLALALSGIPAPPPRTGAGGGALNESQVPEQYRAAVLAAGTRCPEVSSALIAAQIEAESDWNPNTVSSAGAQGISQFMPATWAQWGKDYSGDGKADPFNPTDAIGSQADFMCHLAKFVTEKLGTGVIKGEVLDLTLAAYNAGPGAVVQSGGVPQFAETQGYVAKIRKLLVKYTVVPAPGGSGNSSIVAQAQQWLGLPYVWAGGTINGPSGIGRDGRGPGFDCSGLTLYAVYHATGIELPHQADVQIRDQRGREIPRDWAQMQPGDLIAFSDSGGRRYQHIGIYIGNGQMIHAPTTGKNVMTYNLRGDRYYTPMVWSIRRFG